MLPGSGILKISDIRTELGLSYIYPFLLGKAQSGGYEAINVCSSPHPPTPGIAHISDWYLYNNSALCCVTGGSSSYSYISPYYTDFTLNTGYEVTVIPGGGLTGAGTYTAYVQTYSGTWNNLVTFNYTQAGSGPGTWVPSSYTLTVAQNYRLSTPYITDSLNLSLSNCQPLYYSWVMLNAGADSLTCNSARTGSTGGPSLYVPSANGNIPYNGETVYNDITFSTVFEGTGNWYGLYCGYNSTYYAMQISISGVISNLSSTC